MLSIEDLNPGMTKQTLLGITLLTFLNLSLLLAICVGLEESGKFTRVVVQDPTGIMSLTCFRRHLIESLTIGDVVVVTGLSFSTWNNVLQGLMCPVSSVRYLSKEAKTPNN